MENITVGNMFSVFIHSFIHTNAEAGLYQPSILDQDLY